MRSLGKFYFKSGMLDESIECLQKSLSINSMFKSAWFTPIIITIHIDYDIIIVYVF